VVTCSIRQRRSPSGRCAPLHRQALIDEVTMADGPSRIPVFAERLTELPGKVTRLGDLDLAVAKDAALRTHQLLAGSPPGR
jgi:molecular chaperone DnaK (HSP70)